MTNPVTIVATRTRLFGKSKNIGGMENYCLAFIDDMSFMTPIIVVDASGTYLVESGLYKKIGKESASYNAYTLTITVGFRVLFQLFKNSNAVVYSFGYAGILVSLAKTFGLYSKTKLIVALFGLESVDKSKSKKTVFVKMQYFLGVRSFLGSNILKKCSLYLTEHENHHMDYIKMYPFLLGRTYLCLPDPIEVPKAEYVERIVENRWESLNSSRQVKFITVGRDSSSKRRDISIELFKVLRVGLREFGFNCSFSICVSEASQQLLTYCALCDDCEVIIGASNEELTVLRSSSQFSISTSDQKVPLLAVLEDMAQGVIPVSTDDLGGSLTDKSSLLIGDDWQSHAIDLLDIISDKQQYAAKAKAAHVGSKEFSRDKFKAILSSLIVNYHYVDEGVKL